jgi:hypothetical protein
MCAFETAVRPGDVMISRGKQNGKIRIGTIRFPAETIAAKKRSRCDETFFFLRAFFQSHRDRTIPVPFQRARIRGSPTKK